MAITINKVYILLYARAHHNSTLQQLPANPTIVQDLPFCPRSFEYIYQAGYT